MKACDVCKQEGTLAVLPTGVKICTKCIAELVADGFTIKGIVHCAICNTPSEPANLIRITSEHLACPSCARKWRIK